MLQQHDLKQIQLFLSLGHIADVAEQVREEKVIHRSWHVGGVHSHGKGRVFGTCWVGEQDMWCPGLDIERRCVRCEVDILRVVGVGYAHAAGQDLDGLGLVEVEVKRWNLYSESVDLFVVWSESAIPARISCPLLSEDGLL